MKKARQNMATSAAFSLKLFYNLHPLQMKDKFANRKLNGRGNFFIISCRESLSVIVLECIETSTQSKINAVVLNISNRIITSNYLLQDLTMT